MFLVLKIGLGFYAAVYAVLKLLPVQKKIVFLSRQGNSPSLDFRMLEKEVRRSHPDWKTVMLCRKIERSPGKMLGYCFHMLRQAYHIATARAAVLDSYCIMISCMHHRKSLLVLQIWHSVGTMKKSGYSVLDQPEGSSSRMAKVMHMHENYDYVLAAADSYKPYMAEAFRQDPDTIVTLALPRIQLLKDPDYAARTRRKIFKVYPELAGREKINLVYCPTFRKGKDEAAPFREAVSALLAALDFSRYNLIVKCHPLSDIPEPEEKIPGVVFDRQFSTFQMLFAADRVISDYSCVIYEAAVRDIPLYFYDYDYDEYMRRRGIYMDYEKEVPGPICRSAEELRDALEEPYDKEKLRQFSHKYVSPENHDETQRIVDFIFRHLK